MYFTYETAILRLNRPFRRECWNGQLSDCLTCVPHYILFCTYSGAPLHSLRHTTPHIFRTYSIPTPAHHRTHPDAPFRTYYAHTLHTTAFTLHILCLLRPDRDATRATSDTLLDIQTLQPAMDVFCPSSYLVSVLTQCQEQYY